MLYFPRLKIAGPTASGKTCGGDFLRIIDGSCYNSASPPYSMYCGLETPMDPFISTTNQVCLKFVSDNSQSNQGFAVKYTTMDRLENEPKLVGKLIFPVQINWNPKESLSDVILNSMEYAFRGLGLLYLYIILWGWFSECNQPGDSVLSVTSLGE